MPLSFALLPSLRAALHRAPPTVCLLLLLATARALVADPVAPNFELINGLWLDGETFVARTVYVEKARLRLTPPATIDEVVDLDGGYVVPPFAEAHTHNAALRRAPEFLRQGIFYAKVQGIATALGHAARPWFARTDTLDASLSLAPLTASNGHPMEMTIGQPGVAGVDDIEGNWAHTIDRPSDLVAKWPRILAGRPDFLKTFLLYSDEFEARAANPAIATRYRGMDPALLPEIVRRAHLAGLRVSTHVRTTADFRNAVSAGVDEIAHLPGYSIGPSIGDGDDVGLLAELDDASAYRLDSAAARVAADAGVVVVTTAGGPTEVPEGVPPELRELFQHSIDVHREVQRHNLALLRRHGVPVALGWDRETGTVVDEALYLADLGPFDLPELLTAWTLTTAQTIFPGRKIGLLGEGYEASFLVLDGNPLEDFVNVTRIRLRFKAGRPL